MSACTGRRNAKTTGDRPVGQLTMSLLASILRVRLGQLFCYDQLRYVDAIAQQVRYGLFGVLHGSVWISVDEDLLQATVDEVGHQGAVVAAHCLNALTCLLYTSDAADE